MLNQYDRGADNEPAEIRQLTKSQLYKLLAAEWILPNKDSRGVTREYLAGVYQNQLFRVGRLELQQFEARLLFEDLARNSFFNMSVVLERLIALMTQLGLPPLGFNENVNPDETWVCRIARYIDQWNILRIFRRRVPGT